MPGLSSDVEPPSRFSRRHLLRGLGATAAIAAVTSLLQACQATPSSSTSPAATRGATAPAQGAAAPTAAAVAPAAASQPRRGGTLNVGLPVDPGTMDTRLQNDTSAANINDLCYNGLVVIDANITPQPDLATSWETPDPTTYIFHLRQGVTFHDGSPLTAEDVKYTFETMVDPAFKSPRRSLYAPVQSVEVVDPQTAKFTLSQPYAPLLSYMDVGIVSKATAGQPGNTLSEAPMGTGPFKFTSWEKGNRIILGAFDGYHAGRPNLDGVVLQIIPDNGVRAVGIESGSLDLIQSPLNAEDVNRLKTNAKIKTSQTTGLGITYINLNTGDPLLRDKRVRQALAWLTDRDTIASTIYGNMDQPGKSSLLPGTWFADDSVQGYGYDPAKAKTLLQDAGWAPGSDGILQKGGQRFQLNLTTYNDPNRMQLLQFLQNSWRQAGVDVNASYTEWPPFIDAVQNGKYQASIIGWLLLVDPDRAMYRQFSTKGDSNWGKYANDQVDNLLQDARQKSDQATRKKGYADAAKLILDDSPYIYVTYQGYVAMTRDNVQGYVVNPSQSIKGIEKAWLA